MKNPQQGLSLLEILCSLAIIAILATIVANFYATQNKTLLQVSKAAEQIQQLGNVSYEWQTAQSKLDFNGISISALQDAGLLPTDNYSQQGPWGGLISLSADSSYPQYILITLENIPPEACSNLRDRLREIAHNQSSASECAQGRYYIVI